jgi:hypothetical protein
MTSLPAWAADPGSLTLTEAQYDALPDRVRRLIEVIDGNVIFCPGGTPEHAHLTRTLAIRLDAARPAQPCTRVCTGADVHFTKRRHSDGTLSFRRPDISVSRVHGQGRQTLRPGRAHGRGGRHTSLWLHRHPRQARGIRGDTPLPAGVPPSPSGSLSASFVADRTEERQRLT